jgi:CheY-like chemotaxis protein
MSRLPLSPSGGAAARPRRLLVVHEEPDTRRVLRMLLEARGAEVHVANRGRAALATFERVAPDTVLLAYALGDLRGDEVARRLRARASATRIVALTPGCDPEAARACLEAGCDASIDHPSDLDDLERALEAVLR